MEAAVKKILIVDDHNLFRDGLISLFRFKSVYAVVGGAESVFEGIRQAKLFRPDIILMDFSLPDGTGLDATRAILPELPDCKIVFLTMHESDEKLFTALRMGAKGYLLKSIASTDLLANLQLLEGGEMAISHGMLSRVAQEFARQSLQNEGKVELQSRLSPREAEILQELESGASNIEIAQRLFLSENTVKHHLHNIFEKLEVSNRQSAVALARQMGIRSGARDPVSHSTYQ
jgi:DNA-binding NarL/FixJ family response regulator